MHSEIFDLAERDRLVFGRNSVRWRVVLRVCAEGANVDLAGRNSTVGIDLARF